MPFCCQGNENRLTIEGGETLGYEMVSVLGGAPLDRIAVRVGGGALASSVIQAFIEARLLGMTPTRPRLHAVQTRGAFPLKRAYDPRRRSDQDGVKHAGGGPALRRDAPLGIHVAREQEPCNIAHGILDDETYDWFVVVKGMLDTGGSPIVVDEQELAAGYRLARSESGAQGATPGVDHTGAAGLAGLERLLQQGLVGPDERRRGDLLRRRAGETLTHLATSQKHRANGGHGRCRVSCALSGHLAGSFLGEA